MQHAGGFATGLEALLGADIVSLQINQQFLFAGDAMKDTSLLLVPLIDAGLKVLIYAGVQDMMCNCT